MIKRKKVTLVAAMMVTVVLLFVMSGCGSNEAAGSQKNSENTTAEQERETIPVYKSVSEFKEKSEKGEKCKLEIQEVEGGLGNKNIIFDGEMYYKEGKENRKYQYIVELSGRLYNVRSDSYIVILSDKMYTWQDYAFLMHGNQFYDENGNQIYNSGDMDDMQMEFFEVAEKIIIKGMY